MGTGPALSPLIMSWMDASNASTRVDICVTTNTARRLLTANADGKTLDVRQLTPIEDLVRHIVKLGV